MQKQSRGRLGGFYQSGSNMQSTKASRGSGDVYTPTDDLYSLTIMVTGRQGIHCLIDKLVQWLSLCCAISHSLISVHRQTDIPL